MKRGEIWLVKLDKSKSVGHEYHKDRPAIIIMSDSLLPVASVITVIPMSSIINLDKHDIIIKKDESNRLFQDSVIKVAYIASYDKSRFIHKIGQLDSCVMRRIERYLKIHFSLK